MLTFLLITRNEGLSLRRTLESLADVADADDEILVVDCGSEDDTLPELEAFMERRRGEVIRFDPPGPTWAEAVTLARGKASQPYLFRLTPGDVLLAEGMAHLRAILMRDAPEAVILNRLYWLGTPDVRFPAPDAARMAAMPEGPSVHELLSLAPEPGRLLIHRDLASRPGGGPLALGAEEHAWKLWQGTLTAASTVALCRLPVLCTRVEERRAAPEFDQAGAMMVEGASLTPLMNWLDDALSFANPGEAREIVGAARAFLAALGDGLGDDINPGQGMAAAMLADLRDDGPAMALAGLGCDLAARAYARNAALAEAVGRLRSDLDLALPGPEYLRRLYDRIRAR